jgi:hypothetical protein
VFCILGESSDPFVGILPKRADDTALVCSYRAAGLEGDFAGESEELSPIHPNEIRVLLRVINFCTVVSKTNVVGNQPFFSELRTRVRELSLIKSPAKPGDSSPCGFGTRVVLTAFVLI